MPTVQGPSVDEVVNSTNSEIIKSFSTLVRVPILARVVLQLHFISLLARSLARLNPLTVALHFSSDSGDSRLLIP